MPWYKVPLAVYLKADDAGQAQDRALALVAPAAVLAALEFEEQQG